MYSSFEPSIYFELQLCLSVRMDVYWFELLEFNLVQFDFQ